MHGHVHARWLEVLAVAPVLKLHENFYYCNFNRNITINTRMGLSKTEGFTRSQLELAAMAKALAHPARIAILQHLARQKSCVCGDIVNELPLSQSTVSQHLKELKEAGLIKGNIDGPSICYCIDEKIWNRVTRIFADLFHDYNPKNCC